MKNKCKVYIVVLILLLIIQNIYGIETAAATAPETKTMIEVASQQVLQETKQYLGSADSYSSDFDFESVSIDKNCLFAAVYNEERYNEYDENKFWSCMAEKMMPEDIIKNMQLTVDYYAVNKNGYTCYIDTEEMSYISFFSSAETNSFLYSDAVIMVDNVAHTVSDLYIFNHIRDYDGKIIYYRTTEGTLYVSLYDGYKDPDYMIYTADELSAKAQDYIDYKDSGSEDIGFYDFAQGLTEKPDNNSDTSVYDMVIVCVISIAVFSLGAAVYIKDVKKL